MATATSGSHLTFHGYSEENHATSHVHHSRQPAGAADAAAVACAPAAIPGGQAPTAGEAAATEAVAEAPAAEAAASGTKSSRSSTGSTAWTARIEAMNQLIAQFEAENPNIKVIHNSDIPYDDFRNKIAASVPAGVGPDVVSLLRLATSVDRCWLHRAAARRRLPARPGTR